MKKGFTLQFFALAYALIFTSFSYKKNNKKDKVPPATTTYTITVSLPNTCSPRNWSVSYLCGNPGGSYSSSRISSTPIVGGGGTGNPRGKEVLAFLFYQSLSEQEKLSFKQSGFAPAFLNDINKFKIFELDFNKESSIIAETELSVPLGIEKGFDDLEKEVNKVNNASVRKKIFKELKEIKQTIKVIE